MVAKIKVFEPVIHPLLPPRPAPFMHCIDGNPDEKLVKMSEVSQL